MKCGRSPGKEPKMIISKVVNKKIKTEQKAFLLPFKYGAVSLAHKTNATLVPFAVTGDYVFHGDNLTYRFGKPFKAQDDLEKTNKYLYRQIGNLMRTSLKEEEKRKKAKKKQK